MSCVRARLAEVLATLNEHSYEACDYMDKLASANTFLRSDELDRALEDAERYQRIRLGLSERHGDVYAMVFGPEGDYPLMGPPLDAAIDAARKTP